MRAKFSWVRFKNGARLVLAPPPARDLTAENLSDLLLHALPGLLQQLLACLYTPSSASSLPRSLGAAVGGNKLCSLLLVLLLLLTMAEASALEELQTELTCPVCLELFRDPVILDCGHHFCQLCIIQCWEAKAEEPLSSCPKCRKSCSRKLRPNSLLCNVVDSVRRAGVMSCSAAGMEGWDPAGAAEEPEEREPGSSMSSLASSIGHWPPRLVADMCEEHEEKLKLYCEDDQLPICLVCGMSRDHKTHNVIPINEAFENYKVHSGMPHTRTHSKSPNVLRFSV